MPDARDKHPRMKSDRNVARPASGRPNRLTSRALRVRRWTTNAERGALVCRGPRQRRLCDPRQSLDRLAEFRRPMRPEQVDDAPGGGPVRSQSGSERRAAAFGRQDHYRCPGQRVRRPPGRFGNGEAAAATWLDEHAERLTKALRADRPLGAAQAASSVIQADLTSFALYPPAEAIENPSRCEIGKLLRDTPSPPRRTLEGGQGPPSGDSR